MNYLRNKKLYLVVLAVTLSGCAEIPLFKDEPAPPPPPPAKPPEVKPAVVPAPVPPAAPAQPNLIPQAAQRAGVNKCAPKIKQFTDFLTAKSQHGAQLFVGPGVPDNSLASVAMEVQANNQTAFVDASFVPGMAANECGGLYEKVVYWPTNCAAVAANSEFVKLKQAGNLRQSIITLNGGDNLKVFLMPAGQNCVSIKKEVVYK